MTLINCGLTRMTRIKNYVPKQKIMHVETVALLSKLDVDKHISVEIELDEMDLTSAESKATYAQIKEYVWNKSFNIIYCTDKKEMWNRITRTLQQV
ncbi:Uncharacterised protein [Urinicoccus massiliensis]|uniref:Uncharacterized protein n=1 Tax=Urinicoccus massiliensis TaxID=1723382 RepID=A0A8H2QY43_9FIRM|nr:Uncharacterised protein [Urinicoccus massiliensis]